MWWLANAVAAESFCLDFALNVWPGEDPAPLDTLIAIRGTGGRPPPDTMVLRDEVGVEVPIEVDYTEFFDYFSLVIRPQIRLQPDTDYALVSPQSLFDAEETVAEFTLARFTTGDQSTEGPAPEIDQRFTMRTPNTAESHGIQLKFEEMPDVAWVELEVYQGQDDRRTTFPVVNDFVHLGYWRCHTTMHLRPDVVTEVRARPVAANGDVGAWELLDAVTIGCDTSPAGVAWWWMPLVGVGVVRRRR
jgi:hypothetical protein